jgi:hypothetical protein
MTRLVLIEGLPGSGKSTTAQWVARQLERQGRAAEWFYEMQKPHPVTGAVRASHASWQAYFTDRLASWAAFTAARRSADTVTVLEGALLQDPIVILRRRDVAPAVITAFVEKVAEFVQPLDPALVYLAQPAPGEAFRATCARRGAWWTLFHIARFDGSPYARARGLAGLDGLVHYWREHTALSDRLAERLPFRRLLVDPRQGDWPWRRRAIGGFLGLPAMTDEPVAGADLAGLAGAYRRREGAGARELSVVLRDGALELDGFLWPGQRLLPRGGTVFDLEGWPFTLTFAPGPDGPIRRLDVSGPGLAGGIALHGSFERIA